MQRYSDLHHSLAFGERDVQSDILLTGATGFLGSHYLFFRLRRPGTIYVLVRGETIEAARKRLLAAQVVCAASYRVPFDLAAFDARVKIVLGDVTLPGCGLGDAALAELAGAGVGELWHCAASLKFLDRHRDEIFRTNLEGTCRVIELAGRLAVGRFVHISTAYVAGTLSGAIPEQLQPDLRTFNNCYEESKHRAELAVAARCDALGMAWNILRPTVIIGPSEARCSGGTRFGVYGFMDELYRSRAALSAAPAKIRLVVDPETVINYIPVDQVVHDMLHLGLHGFEDRRVYHLAGGADLDLQRTIRIMTALLELDTLDFVPQRDGEPSSVEALFDRRMAFYAGYFRSHKRFERSLPAHRSLSWDEFSSFLTTFRDELDAAGDGNELERHQIKAPCGADIVVYTLGDATLPTAVLANAYGMPVEFMLPMARRLAHRFRTITWETRWVPALDHTFDPQRCGSDVHARDMIAILDHFNVRRAVVVGWSSGAQIALRALAEHPDRLACGVLLGGTVSTMPEQQPLLTEFERNLRTLFPRIVGNMRYAKKYCDIIYGAGLSSDAGAATDRRILSSVLTNTDPFLLHLTSVPFRTPERLHRYAHMVQALFDEYRDDLPERVHQPVLVSTGGQDRIASEGVARSLGGRLTQGVFHSDPQADHFAHYYDPAVAALVAEFIGANGQAPAHAGQVR